MDPIASILHRMLCGRFDKAGENKGYTSGASPLPGSDPIEASRRRYFIFFTFLINMLLYVMVKYSHFCNYVKFLIHNYT